MQQAQALVAQLALEAEALARLRAAVVQRDVGALEGALQLNPNPNPNPKPNPTPNPNQARCSKLPHYRCLVGCRS